jgi:hypothetical protein
VIDFVAADAVSGVVAETRRRDRGRIHAGLQLRGHRRVVVPTRGCSDVTDIRRVGERRDIDACRKTSGPVGHGNPDEISLGGSGRNERVGPLSCQSRDHRGLDRPDGHEVRPVLDRQLWRVRFVLVEWRSRKRVEVQAGEEVVLCALQRVRNNPLPGDERVLRERAADERRVIRLTVAGQRLVACKAEMRADIHALLHLLRGVYLVKRVRGGLDHGGICNDGARLLSRRRRDRD